MLAYLYTITFNVFLNSYFRFPTPFLFGIPLVVLFWQAKQPFLYLREVLVLFALNLLFYVIAQNDIKGASVNLLVIIVAFLYYNFFVGTDFERFKLSIVVYYSLLTLSAIIMLCNHVFRSQIDNLRVILIGSPISQSPSGICSAIFSFGYQLSALVSFLFVCSILYSRSLIIRLVVLFSCLTLIYFGMQRSVLVTFGVSAVLFLGFYYRYKAIIILGLTITVAVAFSSYYKSQGVSQYDNIFAKNERDAEEDRGGLMTENLRIYSDYPLGLMFYGKNWNDVTKYNKVYAGGLTSHNAYLMFVTYLGPFIGIGLLLLVYYRIGKIFRIALLNINNPEYSLLLCLCFSFLAISLNSMFHNASFIGAEGASVFLYFAILHRYNMQTVIEIVEEEKVEPVQNIIKKNTRILSYE